MGMVWNTGESYLELQLSQTQTCVPEEPQRNPRGNCETPRVTHMEPTGNHLKNL